MALLKRTKPAEPVEVVSPDEQALRQRYAQVNAELDRLESDLRQVEAERDAALVVAESVRARAGGSVELWRAEESRDAAVKRCGELVELRRPLAAEHARLRGYLGPIDDERRQLEVLRRSLVAWERLAEVLPLLDQAAAVIESARLLGTDTSGNFAVPSSLAELVRQLGPNATGMRRGVVEQTIRTHVDGKRSMIARLSGGAS